MKPTFIKTICLYAYRYDSALSWHCEQISHTGVRCYPACTILPPETLIISEIITGRWEDCYPPLPAADEGGSKFPQLGYWRVRMFATTDRKPVMVDYNRCLMWGRSYFDFGLPAVIDVLAPAVEKMIGSDEAIRYAAVDATNLMFHPPDCACS